MELGHGSLGDYRTASSVSGSRCDYGIERSSEAVAMVIMDLGRV